MTNVNIQKQTKVSRAVARLEQVVDKLESAMAAKIERSPGDDEQAIALMDQLENLHSENTELKLMNKTVSGRLNGTIDRLKTVLEA